MTTYDNGSVVVPGEAPLVSLNRYADMAGKSVRTVQRWLSDGEVPGAFQDEDGRWAIPANARRQRTTGSLNLAANRAAVRRGQVEPAALVLGDQAAPEPAASPLGNLVALEDAAHALGTTVGGVRRLADAGHLQVGPFGPNGALRVFLPPQGGGRS